MDAVLVSVEQALAAQRSLVTRDQLHDGGISEWTVRRLVARNVLKRVRPSVFAMVGVADTWERGLHAVVLSLPEAVASHSAAARLWAFVHRPDARFECTVDRNTSSTRAGVLVHRSSTIAPEDVVTVAEIPATSFERTLCDCTALLSPFQLGRALDDGLRREVASLRRLEDCAQRLESAQGRRMSVVRGLLGERGVGSDAGGSASELRLLDVYRLAGLPVPVQQHRVIAAGKRYRLDFAWPACEVFAEWYGLPWHIGAAAVASDSERLTALAADGWLPLVFTSKSTDGEIIQRTTAALSRRAVGMKTSA